MYTVKFLTLVIRETRANHRDWLIVRPYGTTFATLTCAKPSRIRDAEFNGSVREFIENDEPFSSDYSDEVLAELLERHLELLEGDFEVEAGMA